MTNTPFNRELSRWIFAAGGVIVTFFVMFYCAAFILLFGNMLPRALSALLAGFPLGLLVVLAGSLLAPRYPLKVAFSLWVLCAVPATSVFGFQFFNYGWLSTIAGGGVAVAFIAWWISPRRSPRATRRVIVAAGTTLLAIIGFVYACFIDIPARPDALTPQLAQALSSNDARVKAFYSYDLGGFLDREWLWRIDADSATISQIVNNLGLSSTSTVPESFWHMRPHYWPRSMPAGGKSFQSSMFSANVRGADGEHYFLLYDKVQGRAYVWVKSNF